MKEMTGKQVNEQQTKNEYALKHINGLAISSFLDKKNILRKEN